MRGGQCSWIVKVLLVRGDVIPWETGLFHYNKIHFIIFLNIRNDVKSWVKLTHEH